MLSGVGPAEQLQKFGIDVVADLPGVTAAQTGSRDQGSPIILCRTRLRRRVRLRRNVCNEGHRGLPGIHDVSNPSQER
jgi:hypothetical protein